MCVWFWTLVCFNTDPISLWNAHRVADTPGLGRDIVLCKLRGRLEAPGGSGRGLGVYILFHHLWCVGGMTAPPAAAPGRQYRPPDPVRTPPRNLNEYTDLAEHPAVFDNHIESRPRLFASTPILAERPTRTKTSTVQVIGLWHCLCSATDRLLNAMVLITD